MVERRSLCPCVIAELPIKVFQPPSIKVIGMLNPQPTFTTNRNCRV